MRAPTQLHVVEGGDHSLGMTKRQLRAEGQTQEDVDRRVREVIREFVAEHA
jgi:hypothetical protein